jgi:GxxExxY protein
MLLQLTDNLLTDIAHGVGGGGTAESAENAEEGGRMTINAVTEKIIGCAIAVHRELGPGLLESTYEACLVFELGEAGLQVDRQRALPVVYREVRIDCGYRIDLLVQRQVIVELKAVQTLLPMHEAQLLSYLRLSGCAVGLLINFNVKQLKDGIRRIVHGY